MKENAALGQPAEDHTACGYEAQDPAQRIGVGTHARRKVRSRSRSLVQQISDGEVGDDVYKPLLRGEPPPAGLSAEERRAYEQLETNLSKYFVLAV